MVPKDDTNERSSLKETESLIRQLYPAHTRKSFLLLSLIVCLFVALRLWRLTTYGLWFDEAFSHLLARLSWSGLIKAVVSDVVHPPLFYLLLKIWIAIGGESLLWLKLLPVTVAVASILPLLLLCSELNLSAVETNTALFLIAVNAYLIQNAQELRMYSLLTFFMLSSLWLFVRLVGGKGRRSPLLAGLFVANLLLVHTHYFGWLVVGVEGLYLLFSKREHILPLSLTVAALIICFAPWAYAVSHAAVEKGGLEANLFWVSPPRLADVAGYFASLNGLFFIRRTTSLGLILFCIPLLYWAWKTLQEPKRSSSETFRLLAACSFLPAIFTILASYLIRPVWAGRFLIISALPYLIMISIAVNRLRPAWLKTTMMIVIIGWAALSGTHMLQSGNFRFDWFSLVRHMTHTEKSEKVTVYAFERYVATPLQSALGFLRDPRFEVTRIDDMTAMQRTHFWVAFRDTTWKADRLPQEFLRDSGCQVSDEASASTHIAQNPSVGEAVTVFSVTCPE
jgi:hypothetical protein